MVKPTQNLLTADFEIIYICFNNTQLYSVLIGFCALYMHNHNRMLHGHDTQHTINSETTNDNW